MRTWVHRTLGTWVLGNLGTWVLRNLGTWVIVNLGTWDFGYLGSWELEYWVNEYLGTCAFRKFGYWVHNSFKDNFIKKICNIGVAMATPLTPFLRKLAKVDVIPAFFLLHTETMQWHD